MTAEELATAQAAMFVQRYRRQAKPTLRALSNILDCWLSVISTRNSQAAQQYIMDVAKALSDMTNSITIESKQ